MDDLGGFKVELVLKWVLVVWRVLRYVNLLFDMLFIYNKIGRIFVVYY